MNRLVDHATTSDALIVEAARLVRAAGVSEPDPALKHRIRARLLDREAPRVPWNARSWIVAAVLVSLLAIAGATVTHALLVRDDAPDPAPPIDRALVDPRPAAAPIRAQVSPAPPPAPPPVTPVVVQTPPHRVQPARRDTNPTSPATPPSEATLVLQATRALHTTHDPVRALALLDDYLARYPHGVLVEESLALAIEAASARGDRSASTYARTYLARFPAGRFAEPARTALARFGK